MTAALRCACALALVCLGTLLLLPEGALGEPGQVQQSPEPRAPSWFKNFGSLNKYMEKLFSSSKKPKNQNKTENTTKSSSSNTTNLFPPTTTKPPPQTMEKPQSPEPLGRQSSTSSLRSK